jgi:tetratricopeptide (TPR) repeat protein
MKKEDKKIRYSKISDKKSKKVALYLLLVPFLISVLLFILAIVSSFTFDNDFVWAVFVGLATLSFFLPIMFAPIIIILLVKKKYSSDTVFDERSGDDVSELPSEIEGWNWGASFLSVYWGTYFSVWIAFLSFVPILNYFIWIWLGIKGNELAWRAQKWPSIEEFKRAQKKWKPWGIGFGVLILLYFIFSILSLYSSYSFMEGNDDYSYDFYDSSDYTDSYYEGRDFSNRPESIISKAFSLKRLESVETAYEYLDEKKIELQDEKGYVYFLDAIGYILEEDYDNMNKAFHDAVLANDGFIDYREIAKIIRLNQKSDLFSWDLSKYAIEYLEEHIAKNPDDIGSYVDIVRIFIRDTNEAEKALDYIKIVENSYIGDLSDDDKADYFWALCRSYMDTGRPEEALSPCLSEVTEFPSHRSHNNVGIIYEDLLDYEKAFYHLDKALGLYPNSKLYKRSYDRIKSKLE